MRQLSYLVFAAALMLCACSKDNQPEALGRFFLGDAESVSGGGKTKADVAVDMGLSVDWATCNLGAKDPLDFGTFYAWGEVSSKSFYSWDNYKYYSSQDVQLLKYNTVKGYGKVDGLTRMQPGDDPATTLLGSGWRTPTYKELSELLNGCSWVTKTKNEVKYLLAQSNSTGATMVFPLGGLYSGADKQYEGDSACVWTSDLNPDNILQAIILFSSSKEAYVEVKSGNRSLGIPIRPVREK